jgi:class 3 adenylate cyclase
MNSYYSFVKVFITIWGFFFLSLSSFSQDQHIADSLKKIYEEDNLQGVAKLNLLKEISHNETNQDLSLKYSEELISLSKLQRNYRYMHSGFLQQGNSHLALGNYESSLDAYFKSLDAAIKAKNIIGEGLANMAVANVYSEEGNFNNEADSYYEKAIQLLRKSKDSIQLGLALYNAGDHNLNNKNFELALNYFEEAGIIFKNTDNEIGKAYILGNLGKIYTEQGNYILAESHINDAISVLEKLKDYYSISEFLNSMSDIYLKQDEWETALNYAHRSLNLSQEYGLKKQISDANLQLSRLYEQKGDDELFLKHFNDHKIYLDSITNSKSMLNLAGLQKKYEFAQMTELDKRQKTIIYISIFAFILIFLLALSVFMRYNYAKKTNRIIEQEKNKSDNLLLNILPKETAQELKLSGKVHAQKFESITVLFTDFKGFTQYAEYISPEKLVESVDYYFSKFDEVMERFNLEKIKTVGDSYMCAGGLHYHKEDHAIKMVEAAFEISEFVKECKEKNSKDIINFDMRIGINSGPVVAGVVGTRKFAYDIWGDTVNIASRMESNSEIGKINISENTYELIRGEFNCEYRGEITVKNKGLMKMFFVSGKKDKQESDQVKERETLV